MPKGKASTPQSDLAPINWDAVQLPYEAGILSLRELGIQFGVTGPAILKQARKRGWTRDLTARIHARADEKVNASAVIASRKQPDEIAQRHTIEANADAIVRVRLEHRKDIGRARAVVADLMGELETANGSPELFAEVRDAVDALRGDKADGYESLPVGLLTRMVEVVESLPRRAKVAKDLLEALRIAIGLEREAFGLATSDGADRPTVIIRDFTGKGSNEAPPQPEENGT